MYLKTQSSYLVNIQGVKWGVKEQRRCVKRYHKNPGSDDLALTIMGSNGNVGKVVKFGGSSRICWWMWSVKEKPRVLAWATVRMVLLFSEMEELVNGAGSGGRNTRRSVWDVCEETNICIGINSSHLCKYVIAHWYVLGQRTWYNENAKQKDTLREEVTIQQSSEGWLRLNYNLQGSFRKGKYCGQKPWWNEHNQI